MKKKLFTYLPNLKILGRVRGTWHKGYGDIREVANQHSQENVEWIIYFGGTVASKGGYNWYEDIKDRPQFSTVLKMWNSSTFSISIVIRLFNSMATTVVL
jgi:alpha/beta superfamily hydrolase